MGLVMSAVYLMYCTFNKTKINNDVKAIFFKNNIQYGYFTTQHFSKLVGMVTFSTDSVYHVGFRSVFDSKKRSILHISHEMIIYLIRRETQALQSLNVSHRSFIQQRNRMIP
jgi:hypothetical protein